jgi:hypothetical protein
LTEQQAGARQQEEARVERQQEPQDALAVARARQQPGRSPEEAAQQRDRRGDKHRGRKEILAEVVDVRDARRQEALVDDRPLPEGGQERRRSLEQDLEVPDAEHEEAEQEDDVQQRRRWILHHLAVAEGVGDDLGEALTRRVGHDLVGRGARSYERGQPAQLAHHEAEGDDREGRDQHRLQDREHGHSGHLGRAVSRARPDGPWRPP